MIQQLLSLWLTPVRFIQEKFTYLLMSLVFFVGFISTFSAHSETELIDEVFQIAIPVVPAHLNPTTIAGEGVKEVTYVNVYEGLTEILENGEVAPLLATSWESDDQAQVWTFTLRTDVHFHDKSDFTGQTVKANFDRFLDPQSPKLLPIVTDAIVSVEVLSSNQVRFTLNRTFLDFPYYIGWSQFVMLPEELPAEIDQAPIGTGPFKVTAFEVNNSVRLERNMSYWREIPSNLKHVVIRFLLDPRVSLNALKSKELQCHTNFPSSQYAPVIKRSPELTLQMAPTEGEVMVVFNHASPLLRDLRFRQMVRYGFNRDRLLKVSQIDPDLKINTHFSLNHPASLQLDSIYSFSMQQARSLLQALKQDPSLSHNWEQTLRIVVPNFIYGRTIGQFLKQEFDQLGIKSVLHEVDFSAWFERVYVKKDYDLTVIAHTEAMDLSMYARDEYYNNYQMNPSQQTFAKMWEEYLGATTDDKAKSILHRLQRFLAEEIPHLYMYQLARDLVCHQSVVGYWESYPKVAFPLANIQWTP